MILYISCIFCSVRLRHERDLVVNLKFEEERISKEMELEENDMKKLVEVLEIIER